MFPGFEFGRKSTKTSIVVNYVNRKHFGLKQKPRMRVIRIVYKLYAK